MPSWKHLQEQVPTDAEMVEIAKQPGIAVICGKVSGNLEIVDLEGDAPLGDIEAAVEARKPGLLAKLYQAETPSGGLHLAYRCSVIAGNQKLASSSTGKTWGETRGEGGYFLTTLSSADAHPSGKPYKHKAGSLKEIPEITPEDREILHETIRSFNEHIREEKARGYREATQGNGTKPGEDFNNRGDVLNQVQSLLKQHGWSKFANGRRGELWSRPDVTDHGSATLFESGYLHPFSSNALPFRAGETYSPFAIYTELEHSGDFSAAAKGLAASGYGQSNGHKPPVAVAPSLPARPKPSPHFSFTSAGDLIAEPKDLIAYVVGLMLVCGGFSILAAKPKVGKSTLAFALAVAVSLGQLFFGRATKKGKVILLCLEEKRSEIAERLKRMGANGENIIIHTGPTPADALSALEAAIDEHSPVLVIIDPLSRFVRVADFNSYAETTRALEPLIDMARTSPCGTHILALHHNGKGGDLREGGDAVMGSTGFFAAVDTLMTMRKREKVRTIESTQRYGEDLPETIVHLDLETGMVQPFGDMKAFTLSERKKAVLDVMGHEPIPETAIKELVGGTNGGLTSKAVRSLFDDATLSRSGRGKKGDPYVYWIAGTTTSEGGPTFEDFEIPLEAAYA